VMVAGPDNRAHLQAVQVGIQNGDQVAITDGLKAGQQVVTSGNYGLPDNTRVKIDTSNTSNKAGTTTSD
jgi:HlyD family secretion protein